MSPFASLKFENLYPDCVGLDIHIVSIKDDRADLSLNLHCDRQWLSILNGRVQFGISGAELKLAVGKGSRLLLESELSGDLGGMSGQILEAIAPVSPHHPVWQFTCKAGDSLLTGSWANIKLAGLAIANNTPQFSATLTTKFPQVKIVDAEGLWKHDLSPNKHGVLERVLAQFVWQECLTPYLSCGGTEGYFSTVTGKGDRISRNKMEQLQGMVDQIIQATTEDLLELSKIAQLRPLQDFAGGNLLGTDLSGIDLSGANLERVNLRGATLNDTDFSEANLQGAKLSGADLSGAFLENAKLKNADLHRASLALVNLAGVDLRGANLQDANLSNTTWTGTQVEGAKFSKNSGLSEAIARDLQKRGGILI